MNVLNLFKNSLNRILAKKEIVIIAVVIVPLMIGVAVFFSGKMEMRQHIALVTNHAQSIPKNDRIKIDVMNEKPATSNLLLGKYAAVVEEKNDGTYEVTGIKSKADKELIENFFNFGKIPKIDQSRQAKRGVGTNILGFILMIVLMQGVALTILYPEDRTLKTFRRILTTPVSEKQYIFAQGIFTFLCLYIPTYLVIVITKVCFNIKIGFGLLMLAMLIGILTALSTSLALFISSVLERNISLVASAIYVITCILSGCFYSFTGNNKVLDTICSIIPQKSYMTLIQGIENGNGMLEFKGQLIYLLIWIVALWLLGSIITKRKMRQGIY
ncbi:ABC transporter permease [Clostridium sp. CM028]|uniref:ABC transporter permease n=1 Tax=unclassified Clostridium TaxID=2614128 RepID=UPI001C6E07B6|nr:MULTISPECIES: ABC transporter permease [unclassified Clostridium]MBW9144693.1 ABC transporter permease [Clostridium sp. CM027]MBW9147789.1 ABC transporter permease [Clostridium sp. CM028]UVE40557.1 ABC transporter permease [Clostridium sp. CM027]WLC61233.1 ABC transporter permease [Clostridium sp. CM028]